MHTSSRHGKMHTSNPISFKAMMTVLAALGESHVMPGRRPGEQ
jgi:hypothetical protein